ncbi:ribosomal protein S5 domain 2-type protein [Phlebopus sp. FC_14]|nr:ribosomal protein S5 domain 2-type protein [Phlebopus sp. FC_14]
MSAAIVTSAPGKVLIAGGYLVLNQAYTGLVISTSSRFYAVLRDGQDPVGLNQILVRAPQFIGAEWKYSVTVDDDGRVEVIQLSDSWTLSPSKNPFIHLALQHTLKLALEYHSSDSFRFFKDVLKQGLVIATVGDNDFYSQRDELSSKVLPATVASLSQIKPFCRKNVTMGQVHKTGMGSSAALITSIVSAVLLKFKVVDPSDFLQQDSDARRLAHNTAQFVHCYAQGKVGSGFDVSAAVFGSQVYRRFDPKIINELMQGGDLGRQQLRSTLDPNQTTWDYRVEPFQLPPLVRLVLADVDAGSNTPSLVSKVHKWRDGNVEQAKVLYEEIHKSNQNLANTFQRLVGLHDEHPAIYESAVARMSRLPASQWLEEAELPMSERTERTVIETFHAAHLASQTTRALMKTVGGHAGVDIEPDCQTELLNECIAQTGVICGGVPGAGGFDAIWLLLFEPSKETLPRVEAVWSRSETLDATPLLATESKDGGVRIERLEDVPGLVDVLNAGV